MYKKLRKNIRHPYAALPHLTYISGSAKHTVLYIDVGTPKFHFLYTHLLGSDGICNES
jgi:hypothetical protein